MGKYKFRLVQGAPVSFKGQHMLNLVLALVMVGLGLAFCFADGVEPAWMPFVIMTLIAFAAGRCDHHSHRCRNQACRWWCRCSTWTCSGAGRAGRHRSFR